MCLFVDVTLSFHSSKHPITYLPNVIISCFVLLDLEVERFHKTNVIWNKITNLYLANITH